MVTLIIAVMGIALLSVMAAVGVVHIPASAMARQVLYKETNAGLRMLQNAHARYFEVHRDQDGVVIYPGSNLDMAATVTPAYGFMPADVRGVFTWETRTSYLFGYPAVYICVKPKVLTPEGLDAVRLIKATLPGQSAYLGSTCGATGNMVGGSHLTVWMILAHFNGPPLAAAGVMSAGPDYEPEALQE